MTPNRKLTADSEKKKPVKIRERMFLQCSIVVRPEGKQFSSWCPELDVASSGDTIEEATVNLKDAIGCLLEAYAESGELPQLLNERGVTLTKAEDISPPVFLSGARIVVPSFDMEANLSARILA